MYKYETHLHTYPVSKCAKAGVREILEFYKYMKYDGVFITNHFLNGNINIDANKSYQEKIEYYFSDYEDGVKIGKEIGISVFCGVEMSYYGTDFLVYGMEKEWYLNNPQIMDMGISEMLEFISKNGGYIVHAHPFREASYIDHIRLFPNYTNGVEVINASRTETENDMASIYAEKYNFAITAGTDNHQGKSQKRFAGIVTGTPIIDELDYIDRLKNNKIKIFFSELDSKLY